MTTSLKTHTLIVSNIATQETKKRAAGILAALKNVILKWSSKRHSKIGTLYTICCKTEILGAVIFEKLRK